MPPTPLATPSNAPARPKCTGLCRGAACCAPACPGVSPNADLSGFFISPASTNAAAYAPRPTHASPATSLPSFAKSTLPQNPGRNPRRMNTSAKTWAGYKTKGARLRRRPLQRQNVSRRCPLAQSDWRSGAGESNLLQSKSCKRHSCALQSVSGNHRYMISLVDQVFGCTSRTSPVLNADFPSGHNGFRTRAGHEGARQSPSTRTKQQRNFCANTFLRELRRFDVAD
jgi:hypothetical protein